MFQYDYVCLNGHPVIPGGKFCMHCGSRVAAGAAARTARATTGSRRPAAIQEVPDGFAVVPEGFKLVPIPPMSDAEINAMAAPAAVELVETPQAVVETPAEVNVLDQEKTFETPELNVPDEEPVTVKEVNGISIDDDLASWLNDDLSGWRVPELEIEEPVEAPAAAADEDDDDDCFSPFGGTTIGFGLFPFPGISVVSLGGSRPVRTGSTTGTHLPVRRRSGFGLFLLPMVMFMLLNMLGSAFTGPNSNMTVFPGGMIITNSVPMGNGGGAGGAGNGGASVTP